MLSEHTKTIVKATAPVMKEHGLTITLRMYDIMFTRYPKTKTLFNQTHQENKQQPRALANSIYAYAANIDNLDALSDTIELVAHKHASLNIRPEHYDIVAECLIQAVKDILKEAATTEIISAWTEAYTFLANVFINREEELYQYDRNKAGGWNGFRPFIITDKVKESTHVYSFYLRPQDNQPLIDFQPGQYIALRTHLNNTTITRNYSLSATDHSNHYRISVKREEQGQLSPLLHDQLKINDTVELTAPKGNFTLNNLEQTKQPIVFISGGIGITPLFAMLEKTLNTPASPQITFIHATENSKTHTFKNQLVDYSNQHADLLKSYTCYHQPLTQDQCDLTGTINQDWLREKLPKSQADYYLCGSPLFMKHIFQQLINLGINEDTIHYEYFGPLEQMN
ncbi:Nitric oxide dioxygenase [Piscirickettsia salmonis]|uniref:NO-inducible flavohemoprotein n=1 Tax=Piscirickettsia salmonis TaxID=1238 RepID=UPI0012BAAE04|nr:NO-inducible flavohemoprotein [Piscirickettsia salmonis]QGP53739.1 Nitric oxide dioxygenase [Piscirickettsia salmonis]QGP60351.1 Nitric oxide dioxygenase [Piscirickettsia salmonis]QGP63312.1 Nitric oxide dioxygenase [Piscirickettsia salmonis]